MILRTIKNLKESAYLVCDEYLTTLKSTYELFVCHSGNIPNNRLCYDQINSHCGVRGSRRFSVIFVQDSNEGRDNKHLLLVPG